MSQRPHTSGEANPEAWKAFYAFAKDKVFTTADYEKAWHHFLIGWNAKIEHAQTVMRDAWSKR